MPPITASKVRIIPYSVYRRTVCLRLELRGCKRQGEILFQQEILNRHIVREPIVSVYYDNIYQFITYVFLIVLFYLKPKDYFMNIIVCKIWIVL